MVPTPPIQCPDAQRQRQPQGSGEAAGDRGRGGSGFPSSPGRDASRGREWGDRGARCLGSPPTTLYPQAAAWGIAPQPSAPRGPTGPRLDARSEQPGTVSLENRGLGEACSWGDGGGGGVVEGVGTGKHVAPSEPEVAPAELTRARPARNTPLQAPEIFDKAPLIDILSALIIF